MTEKDQYQNPEGKEGREILKKMNEHHRDLTIWGLNHIPPMHAKQILDIGCGGGNCLKMISVKQPNAKCHGIDISQDAVDATLELNSVFVKWGKVSAQIGSAENIPFPEGTFDLITAVETYFFWKDLEKTIGHVVSRLNEKGIICIISEQYPTEKNKDELAKVCNEYHMNLVDNSTMTGYLEKVGLNVQIFLDEEKNWVTFIGTKM